MGCWVKGKSGSSRGRSEKGTAIADLTRSPDRPEHHLRTETTIHQIETYLVQAHNPEARYVEPMPWTKEHFSKVLAMDTPSSAWTWTKLVRR